MTFEEWQSTVPQSIRADSLWKIAAYRLALFAADLAWEDASILARDRRTLRLSGQLYDAVGSVGANIAEGYSRGSPRDRARFYEYALGSARESRDWYFKARHLLGGDCMEHRLGVLTRLVQLLLTMVPQQRGYTVGEEPAVYAINYEAEVDDSSPPGATHPPSAPDLTHDALTTDE